MVALSSSLILKLNLIPQAQKRLKGVAERPPRLASCLKLPWTPLHGEDPPPQDSVHDGSPLHSPVLGEEQEDAAPQVTVHGTPIHGPLHGGASPHSRHTSKPSSAAVHGTVHGSPSSPGRDSLSAKNPAVKGAVHGTLHSAVLATAAKPLMI